jgi:hypothetical protein
MVKEHYTKLYVFSAGEEISWLHEIRRYLIVLIRSATWPHPRPVTSSEMWSSIGGHYDIYWMWRRVVWSSLQSEDENSTRSSETLANFYQGRCQIPWHCILTVTSSTHSLSSAAISHLRLGFFQWSCPTRMQYLPMREYDIEGNNMNKEAT